MAVLLAHLLKWSRQPEKRNNSWRSTIKDQRKRIALAIKATPSLKGVMRDPDWREDIWLDALAQASKETGLALEDLPAARPWTMEQAADQKFLTGVRSGPTQIPRPPPRRSSTTISGEAPTTHVLLFGRRAPTRRARSLVDLPILPFTD
jgi:Domain of unknown function DUF29